MSTKKTPEEHAEKTSEDNIKQESVKTNEASETTTADNSTEPAKAKAEEVEDKSKKKKDKYAEELEKVKKELTSEKDKYLRLFAEYDNFRKRSQKERENIYADVRADALIKFLPVYDNLERALKQETADEAYSKGVEMTLNQFREIMEKLGVTEIEAAAGTAFDPMVHNAVMHVEDESLGEGVIAEEFQKGFRLGDKVLRCSIVKVAN